MISARRENDPPLNCDQKELAARHLKLARGASRRIKRGFPRLADDFESAASLALCRAAESWDSGSGITFAAWAYPRVRRAVWGVLHDHRRDRIRPYPRFDRLVDFRPRPEAAIADGDCFASLIGRIPPRFAAILDMTYREGLNRRELADRIGTDQPYASRLHAMALELLKGTMDT